MVQKVRVTRSPRKMRVLLLPIVIVTQIAISSNFTQSFPIVEEVVTVRVLFSSSILSLPHCHFNRSLENAILT